jgi:hypothetical protein
MQRFPSYWKRACSGNTLPTLSVRIPHNRALESVSSTASTLREAILRQASYTVVWSGMVSALDSLSLLTVLSPVNDLRNIARFLSRGSGMKAYPLFSRIIKKIWLTRCGFKEVSVVLEPRMLVVNEMKWVEPDAFG